MQPAGCEPYPSRARQHSVLPYRFSVQCIRSQPASDRACRCMHAHLAGSLSRVERTDGLAVGAIVRSSDAARIGVWDARLMKASDERDALLWKTAPPFSPTLKMRGLRERQKRSSQRPDRGCIVDPNVRSGWANGPINQSYPQREPRVTRSTSAVARRLACLGRLMRDCERC